MCDQNQKKCIHRRKSRHNYHMCYDIYGCKDRSLCTHQYLYTFCHQLGETLLHKSIQIQQVCQCIFDCNMRWNCHIRWYLWKKNWILKRTKFAEQSKCFKRILTATIFIWEVTTIIFAITECRVRYAIVIFTFKLIFCTFCFIFVAVSFIRTVATIS